jgi:Fe-S-cluster containining protein
VPTVSCTDCFVWPKNNKQKSGICLENCGKDCLDFRAHFHLLYGSLQYGLPQQKNNPTMKQISSLGFVPTFSWEMCPQCCPKFPLSNLLENLSQSPLAVSCTLPNAFFYKSENDILPPKCLFTFPNPKCKGQD